MNFFRKRLAASLLALTLCTGAFPSAAAVNADGSTTTIAINSSFDFLMQYVEWYGLEDDSGAVLRNYFNQYFERHPEEFTPIVNDIMQSIDPYSHFMTRETYDATYGQTTNNYYGIGVTFSDSLRLTDVYEDGAAAAAGLQTGDVILAVDGVTVTGKPSAEVISLIRGEADSTVVLTIDRNGTQMDFSIIRRQTTPHHVYSNLLSDGVAYVRVAAMGSDEDTQTFVDIWNGFAAKGVRAAILDLRNNGGGLVNMASKMIETITPQANQKYLGLRYNEHSGGLQEFYTPGGGVQLNKLIVLTNGNTASAAEIVSGSLSDLGVATLIGEPTYGKGVGQYHFHLGDSVLVLTSMEIQLPVRGAYNGTPIVPDMYISQDNSVSAAVSLPSMRTDTALVPGMQNTEVSAMTERLSMLGYLKQRTDVFDTQVLQAVRNFQMDYQMMPLWFASAQTLSLLDSLAQQQAANASGLDNQLATALALCQKAAAAPAQYTVHADGSWTNLES